MVINLEVYTSSIGRYQHIRYELLPYETNEHDMGYFIKNIITDIREHYNNA